MSVTGSLVIPTAEDIAAIWSHLTDEERERVKGLLKLAGSAAWSPAPGNIPQQMAWDSVADVVGYGGAAGGGKSDLLAGAAIMRHRKSLIIRNEATQLTDLIDRMAEILGGKEGLNEQRGIWRRAGGWRCTFGSCPNIGDEMRKFKGRARDGLMIDEATELAESQVRNLMGWVRTTDPDQVCRTYLAFNPPTNAEGRWVVSFFGPWLDDMHPNPAQAGELRWFAMVDGVEREVEEGYVTVVDGVEVPAESRTFIPARVKDNPYFADGRYEARLVALPEPLRSQLLFGDFRAGMIDDAWQVIPTAWIDASMRKWRSREEFDPGPMDGMGVDTAAGGSAEEVVSRRHGCWFDELVAFPSSSEPNGSRSGSQVLSLRRDRAVIHVDVCGRGGGELYGWLTANRIQAVPIDGSRPSSGWTEDGSRKFFNQRSEDWWRMREALDPNGANPAVLPNDRKLRAQLAAPRYQPDGRSIKVEPKKDTMRRLGGASIDRADAVVYANRRTMKHEVFQRETSGADFRDWREDVFA